MNAKQSLKKASERIAVLESFNRFAAADIKAYNFVIEQLIAGNSPCPMCNELEECQRPEKDGKGCSEWWLMDNIVLPESGSVKDQSSAGEKSIIEGISPEGDKIDG